MYNADDIHYLKNEEVWENVVDTESLYERARNKELQICFRERSFDIVGRPRYIFYWKETNAGNDEAGSPI